MEPLESQGQKEADPDGDSGVVRTRAVTTGRPGTGLLFARGRTAGLAKNSNLRASGIFSRFFCVEHPSWVRGSGQPPSCSKVGAMGVDVWTPGFSALCGPWEWRCQDWESRMFWESAHTDSEPASGNEGEDKANSCHEELIPLECSIRLFTSCSCLHHCPLKENDIQQQSLRMVEQTLVFWTLQ